MRALVVIGTRPEAIKLAPLVHALAAAPGFDVRTCVTSQHTDLLTPMLAFFGLRPDFDLKVMTPGQTLAGVTTRVLQGMDELLAAEKYDVVVVQGDTTTAFAAGLAAFYRERAGGSRRGGAALGRPGPAVPRGGQPPAGGRAGGLAAGADDGRPRQPARRGLPGRPHLRDRQHRHRRAAAGGRHRAPAGPAAAGRRCRRAPAWPW